jgi:hypothetical protein
MNYIILAIDLGKYKSVDCVLGTNDFRRRITLSAAMACQSPSRGMSLARQFSPWIARFDTRSVAGQPEKTTLQR